MMGFLSLDNAHISAKNEFLEKLVALCQEWTVYCINQRLDKTIIILSALAELSASFIADLPFPIEKMMKEEYMQNLQDYIDRFNGLIIPRSFGL